MSSSRRLPRLLCATSFLVLLHLGWSLHQALGMQGTAGPLMPAAGGAIERLEIQFHRTGAERFLEVYRPLLTALSPSTEVVVAVADAEDREIFEAAHAEWFDSRPGPALLFVLTGRPITSWARDRLAVLEGGDAEGATFLAPPAPMTGPAERVHDWTVPWTVAEALAGGGAAAPRVKIASFHFEGGDLIADEDHVFVATPLFERNPELSEADLLARVEAATGLAAVRVDAPGRPSPDHHIGMFVTPLGEGRVAVADPELALSILERRGELRPDRKIAIGDATLVIDDAPARLERFRAVADRLESEGFELLRLPLLPTTSPYVFASWNNALMEHREGQLQIYLPTYGLESLDEHATEVLRQAGARVHPIRVDRLFRLGGSVRCLSAPLRRGSTD